MELLLIFKLRCITSHFGESRPSSLPHEEVQVLLVLLPAVTTLENSPKNS